MMFLPLLMLGLLGLAAAAGKAKAQGGVHALPAQTLHEMLDTVDDALDELGNFPGNAKLTDAQRVKLHALMAPYKASGELPTAAQVLSVLKQVLNQDQLAIVRAVVPQLFGPTAAPGSAGPVSDPYYKHMLDKLDTVLETFTLSDYQRTQIHALMAPFNVAQGVLPPPAVVCRILTSLLTPEQQGVMRSSAPGAYFFCNADAAHALIVKVLQWIGGAPMTFFKPGVQAALQQELSSYLAQGNISADLPALLEHQLESATYQQLLYDVPELAGAAASSAAADATKQSQAALLASYVTQMGISPEQDAQLAALFSPFTALGKMPPPEIVCSAMAHVLTPEQLSNFSRAMPAFSQACS